MPESDEDLLRLFKQFVGVAAWGGNPSVPPRDTVTLDVYVTHKARTIKLYSGRLAYSPPWGDISELYFETKDLLLDGGESAVQLEGWLDLANEEGGCTCSMCFLPPSAEVHEDRPELSEQGLVKLISAHFG